MPTSTPRLPSLHLLGLNSPRRLSDAVHHVLRDAITDGALPPGFHIREVAIAKQLSVSPTPVREAIRRLEREGLIQTTSHRGAVVAEVSPAAMANLYELHETLEATALRLAAERGPHELGQIRMLLDQIDASLSLSDQSTFNRLDLQFHRAVNELSGNPEMAEMAERTHRRIQAARVCLDVHLPDRPAFSQAQHWSILDAIASGDGDEAEELARLHISSIRDPVLSVLEEAPIEHPIGPRRREVRLNPRVRP